MDWLIMAAKELLGAARWWLVYGQRGLAISALRHARYDMKAFRLYR